MESDYKIVSEKTDDLGEIVSQVVRFYFGSVTTEDELNPQTNTLEPVTRYRRSEMFEEVEYTYG